MYTTRIIWLVVLLIIIGGLFAVTNLDPKDSSVTEENESPITESNATRTISDPEIGLAFTYGERGIAYRENTFLSLGGDHVKTYTLMEESEYEALEKATAPREGPPTLSIAVYKNTNKEWPRSWAESHPQISNFPLMIGTLEETVIGGANAIRYTADGLYPTDTVIVAHGSFVYVITGSYIDEGSPTRQDFDPLLNSITFTPEA